MKELVIISGKGGTGKTSLTAAFAVLAGRAAVLADCDVDAADLHLVLEPDIRDRHEFRAGREAVIVQDKCIACGACLAHCRFDAVKMASSAAGAAVFSIDPTGCEGCGVCVRFCPVQAIDFPERLCGEWLVSETRCGPMVHAQLGAGAENSGKLVAQVRAEARRRAEATGRELVIVDGPPGIGCPVIAAIGGASLVLAVTEPTVSGEHDLERVLSLARHFAVPVAVCLNKWDLNPAATDRIEAMALAAGARLAGRVRYDRGFTRAQIGRRTVVEAPEADCAADVRDAWARLQDCLSRN